MSEGERGMRGGQRGDRAEHAGPCGPREDFVFWLSEMGEDSEQRRDVP